MKRISILLVLASAMMLMVSTGWSQITQLTPYYRTYLGNVVSGGSGGISTTGSSGNASNLLATQSIITIQLILTHNTTLQSANAFSYDGVDPVTGMGFRIYTNSASDDIFYAPLFPGDVHVGTKVQAIGSITPYYQTLEFLPGNTPGFNTQGYSYLTVLGTGFGIPTTLISSLAACTSVDTTALTGGQYYMDRLVRVNNVSMMTTASRYTTQFTLGKWSTSGSIPLIDASISNVTTLGIPGYGTYTGLNIINLDMAASDVSTFNANPSQVSTFFSIVTAMPFNLVGVFDQNSFPGPILNPMYYWIYGRGESLGSDVTPYIPVSPAVVSVHPGGSNVTFSATGGFPPYTWSLNNTAVGSINSTSGVFSPSSTAGTSNVIATDSKGYTATVVGVVTNTATSTPLAPDMSLSSMTVPKGTSYAVIKPSE